MIQPPFTAISSIFISAGAFTVVSTGLAVASESAIFAAPWANNNSVFINGDNFYILE